MEETSRPAGSKWLVLLTTALATTLTYWTSGALIVALPAIAAEFGVSASEASAVTMVYYLAMGALTLPFGRLGDSIGHHKVFLTGVALATVLSGITPLFSNSLAAVIALRAITGVALSMSLSVTQAILVTVFPGSERGKVIGINSMLVAGTGMLGQLLCGFILESLSWKVLFLIPVPLGILCLILGFKVLRGFEARHTPVDVAGTILIVVMLVSFTLMLKKVTIIEGVNLNPVLGGVAAVCLVAFILAEKRSAHPLIILSLFRSRAFTMGYLLMAGAYMMSGLTTTTLPFYLQNVLLVSKSISGVVALVYPLAMVLLATRCGALSDRIGTRKMVLCGIAVQSVALFLFAMCGGSTSVWVVSAIMLLYGIASAMFFSPNAASVVNAVPPEAMGMVSGMTSTVRSISNSIGQNLFSLLIAGRSAVYMLQSSDEALVYNLAQRDMEWIAAAVLLLLFILGVALIPSRKHYSARSDKQ